MLLTLGSSCLGEESILHIFTYIYVILSIGLSSSLAVVFVFLQGISTDCCLHILCSALITSEARKPRSRRRSGKYVALSLTRFDVAGSEQITCSSSEHAAATRRSRRKKSRMSEHSVSVDQERFWVLTKRNSYLAIKKGNLHNALLHIVRGLSNFYARPHTQHRC